MQNMPEDENLNWKPATTSSLSLSLTIKEYLWIKFLIIIPQFTWHNSLLVTSPTTSTPGITSTCQGSTCLTYLNLAYPSLERPSGTPCLKISSHVFLFLVSNVICTNLRIPFRQIWTDLFESHVCLKKESVVHMYAYKIDLILMFLHICRNYETVLINCLIVLIIFVCGIVVFICVWSIARTGC